MNSVFFGLRSASFLLSAISTTGKPQCSEETRDDAEDRIERAWRIGAKI
ncbi:hypothetical protein ABID16_000253 [Rhizobium aquaticum]|uniref:Uncharacterized protein n=1 Tax=Rhizobium aquaticum TaxID=1549636 RepID=A0ABV2IU14_9HYPH